MDRNIGGPILAGLAILAAPALVEFGGWGYGLLITTPPAIPIIGGAIEGLAPGPSGTLTISSGTRLTEQEISAGARYAKQSGTALAESAHKGEEFVDAAKK